MNIIDFEIIKEKVNERNKYIHRVTHVTKCSLKEEPGLLDTSGAVERNS